MIMNITEYYLATFVCSNVVHDTGFVAKFAQLRGYFCFNIISVRTEYYMEGDMFTKLQKT